MIPSWRELRTWLDQYRSRHTRRAYRADLEDATIALGPVQLADASDLSEWLKALPEGRRRRAHAAIRSYLRFGRRAGWWQQASGLALRQTIPKRLPPQVLSEAEIGHLFALERRPRNRRLLALLYYGGLRVAEAVEMRLGHLDGPVLRVAGKGDKERSVRLPDGVVALLQTAEEFMVCPLADPGRSLSTRRARAIVHEAAERIGLELGPHDLRHAHATHAVRAGCPIHILQATLGHASLKTTALYMHAAPSEGSSTYLPTFKDPNADP